MIRVDTVRLSLCAVALAFAAPAFAQSDARLQTRVYDETAVFTIPGKVKVQTTIQFRSDEAIENVAIGDSQAWQVQPNKAQSLLFVKPLQPNAKTNMTVVTSLRTYLFDLVASPRNNPLYVMKFSYPKAEKAEEEARLAAVEAKEREQATAVELAAANDPYAVADPELLNFEWESEGDRDLFPARAYDNGDAVFLTWPVGTPIPAILVTNYDGEEGPVNFTVRGDTVVLDTVPAKIILRSGEDTAILTNNGPVPSQSRSAAAYEKRNRGS
ncbi:TrbG/VirB9 family P-type conjugative transfer protein [Erythrobacter sp. F6033]|uniref:TrbG/VirB9 family P-type conjugative transfer protein n=1 Tax=Erythrobacter sp. F6033 TaxID=2926401 RepID=UPI001FF443C4|nr:TrbG/VirB9 family P-type conjugative transfer protein [Erythrobacter sp. F6033]MCK0127705.1 TrbG/VirB9 family P-type conjugative transfer protein [Erythrobacter sp. F6033]